MAACMICGGDYKSSDLVELWPELPHFKICPVCDEVKSDLFKAVECGSEEEFQNSVTQLKARCTDSNVMSVVTRYIDNNFDVSALKTNQHKGQTKKELIEAILLTSSNNFEGYNITSYLGFISSEVASGMGVFKALGAGIANTFGAEASGLSGKLTDGKEHVIRELKKQAFNLDANAIIGVDLDYTMFGDSILATILSGTAVKIEAETTQTMGTVPMVSPVVS